MKMAPTQAAMAKMTEPDSRAPWKTISFETKPLSGQTPEMARAQTVKPAAVSGISRARPPSFLSSVVPVRCSTEPALRKSPHLYMAWLIMWKIPPAMPMGTAVPMPRIM